jgi:hypothetical protein
MNPQLSHELTLLYAAEAAYKVAAAPIVRQLIADDARPLPDAFPTQPAWTAFEWPANGSLNFESYWKEIDRRGWRGEYL